MVQYGVQTEQQHVSTYTGTYMEHRRPWGTHAIERIVNLASFDNVDAQCMRRVAAEMTRQICTQTMFDKPGPPIESPLLSTPLHTVCRQLVMR